MTNSVDVLPLLNLILMFIVYCICGRIGTTYIYIGMLILRVIDFVLDMIRIVI